MTTLEQIVTLWRRLIAKAKKHKEEKFGRTARRAWDFTGKSYADLYENVKELDYQPFPNGGGPFFKARLNLSQQFVNLYLPHLHFRIPRRTVTPDRPQMPPELFGLITEQEIPPGTPMPKTELQKQDLIRAWLMEWYLNYTPAEYNLKREGEVAIKEALVKGRGLVWHHMVDSPIGPTPVSEYGSVDELQVDPECEQFRDAGWIVRQQRRNRFKLADDFELEPERLKRVDLSGEVDISSDTDDTERDTWKKQNMDSKDETIVYYEIYCRDGIGLKYAGGNEELRSAMDELREQFGDMENEPCYLVLVPGVAFPLNLPPEVFTETTTTDEIRTRLEWPIPFHRDRAFPWPCTPLDFDPHTRDPWAKSPLEAGLPLQVFLDQCYGFLMDRIVASARNLLFVSDELESLVKTALVGAVDQSVIPVSNKTGQEIKNLIYEMTFETVSEDLYRIIMMVQREFEKITGQDPLLGGSIGNTQPRSSAEVQIRDSRASSRPDDYAERVGAWHGEIARKEGFATRLLVPPPEPLFGEQSERDPETKEIIQMGPMSQAWASLVNTDNPDLAAAELSYSIVTGSEQKKDKAKQAQVVQMVAQSLVPLLGQVYTATGVSQPLNAFVQMLADLHEIRLDEVMFPDLQQMMAEQGQEGQQDGEQESQAAQAAAMVEQIKVQMELAKAETEKVKVTMEEVKLELEKAKIEMERQKLETEKLKIETERAKADTQRAKAKAEREKATAAKAQPQQGAAA